MTGWTPVPDALTDTLFRLAKRHNKKAALELYLLSKTCRRSGWNGLTFGQVRITETQVSELLGMSRGGAHKVLASVMAEAGLVRVTPSVLAWEAPLEAPIAPSKQVETLGIVETLEAPMEAAVEAASITILQEPKRERRSAPMSPDQEGIMEKGLVILKGIYPVTYADGEPAPRYSPSLTRDRIRALAPRHGVMPILEALEKYYEASKGIYWKAPQNFLGAKGPWRDFLGEAE